jgi:phosphatidylglycerophosphatase A
VSFGRLLATWFGCGYAPKGPGTAGSLAAIAIAWALHEYAGVGPVGFAILAAGLTLPAIWAADVTARETGLKDPQIVVIDEVVGQWLALAGAGAGAAQLNWKTFLAAFVLFRAFDIWKPPPVRQLEKLPGGTGIVLDDVMAGLYAALVLWAAGWFNH